MNSSSQKRSRSTESVSNDDFKKPKATPSEGKARTCITDLKSFDPKLLSFGPKFEAKMNSEYYDVRYDYVQDDGRIVQELLKFEIKGDAQTISPFGLGKLESDRFEKKPFPEYSLGISVTDENGAPVGEAMATFKQFIDKLHEAGCRLLHEKGMSGMPSVETTMAVVRSPLRQPNNKDGPAKNKPDLNSKKFTFYSGLRISQKNKDAAVVWLAANRKKSSEYQQAELRRLITSQYCEETDRVNNLGKRIITPRAPINEKFDSLLGKMEIRKMVCSVRYFVGSLKTWKIYHEFVVYVPRENGQVDVGDEYAIDSPEQSWLEKVTDEAKTEDDLNGEE